MKALSRTVYLLTLSLTILCLVVFLIKNIHTVSIPKDDFKRVNEREEEGRYSVIDN